MITFSGLGDDTTPPATAAMPTSTADPGILAPVAVPISFVDSFLLTCPTPTISDVVYLLKSAHPGPDRDSVVQELLAKGVSQDTVTKAQTWLTQSSQFTIGKNQLSGWLSLLAAGVAGFHGYRRNKSLLWGIVWMVSGALFPVSSTVFALAQGYGQPKGS